MLKIIHYSNKFEFEEMIEDSQLAGKHDVTSIEWIESIAAYRGLRVCSW